MTLEELKVVISAETAGIKQEINEVKKQLGQMEESSKKSNDSLDKMFDVAKITIFVAAMQKAISVVNGLLEGYFDQLEAETKIETIMKQRMNSTDAEIAKIKELAEAYEDLGVVEADVQLSGAQQLATFLRNSESIEVLIPALNNLLVQQKGVNATTQDAITLGNLFGKVMQGQISSLNRYGISFDAAQEKVLMYGTELEKAATLAQVITDNVGNMNEAMTQTPEGQIKQVRQELDAMKDDIAKEILPIVLELVKTFKDFAIDVAPTVIGVLKTLLSIFEPIVKFVSALVNFISELTGGFNILIPILSAIVAGFIAYKTAMIAVTVATWAKTAADIAAKGVSTWGAFLPVGAAVVAGAIGLTAGIITQVQGYKDGGHPPEGDYFYAGEDGPEFVGTIGGRNTVANQNDIKAGIAEGTYEGIVKANSLKTSRSGGQTIKLIIDGYELKARLEEVDEQKGTNFSLTKNKNNGGY